MTRRTARLPHGTSHTAALPESSVTLRSLPTATRSTLPPDSIPIYPDSITVAFDGAGSLSIVAVTGDSAVAEFTSTGTLSVDVFEIDSRQVGFAGTGAFDVSVVEVEIVAVEFTGSGELSMVIFDGANIAAVTADITGSATFGVEVIEAEVTTVDFTGSGTFDAAVIPQYSVAADFTGTGTLSVQSVEVEDVSFAATSIGTFSVDIVTVYAVSVPFTGAGTLDAAVTAVVFPRQKINKSGSFSASTTRAIVTNWTSDATYPATIVSNKLVVQGNGDCTINARAVGTGGGGNNVHSYLMLNGTTIATYDAYGSGYNAPAWSIARTLTAGDTVWIEATADAFGNLSITSAAYIELVPST